MGKHEIPQPKESVARTVARTAMHPMVHIITLVTLHVVALCVIDKTPLLALLFIH
jgi:hypothetical protein